MNFYFLTALFIAATILGFGLLRLIIFLWKKW